jgi:hypothetical protein
LKYFKKIIILTAILISSLSNVYAQSESIYNNKNFQKENTKIHSMNMSNGNMVDCGKTTVKEIKCEECDSDCSDENCSDHDCSNCDNYDNVSYCIINEHLTSNIKKHSETSSYLSKKYYQYDSIFKPPQLLYFEII